MSITGLKVKFSIPFQYIPIRRPAWYKLQFLLWVENRRLHNNAAHTGELRIPHYFTARVAMNEGMCNSCKRPSPFVSS